MNFIPIGELTSKAHSWDPRKSSAQEPFLYIDISSIDRDRKIILDVQTVLPKNAPSRARQIVRSGDVLVSTVRPNLNAVAIVPFELDGATASTGFTVLRPLKSQLDSRYLFHWVRTPSFISDMVRKATGASYPAISDSIVRNSYIPFCSFEEQRRRAEILEIAERIRNIQSLFQSQRIVLLKSSFVHLFGDPILNQKDWKTKTVEQLCNLVRGASPRPQGDPRYFGGNVPRLMVADITRDGWWVTPKIDSLTEEGARFSRPVNAGTIVMAVSGNVGICSRLAIDACIHDGFVGFTELKTEIIDPSYLMVCLDLLQETHNSRKAGAIFQNLTTHDVKAMEIPLPPLDAQLKFRKIFERVELLSEIFKRSSNTANILNSSVIQRQFSDWR